MTELLPLLAFFVTYKMYDIYTATGVLMLVSTLVTLWHWYQHKKLEKKQLFILASILIFGAFTLITHDSLYLKWKVSLVNWLLSGALLMPPLFKRQPPIESLLGKDIDLPTEVWQRINVCWGLMFFLIGVLNLYIAFNFDEAIWVNFKVFGLTGFTLFATLITGFYMFQSKHQIELNKTKEQP